ncbi:MAG: tyrosine-type recombinase/integrase [Acidimicrobiales bacterium]
MAPKSVRNIHVIIRKALADATRKRLVARNVAIDADAPRVPSPGDPEHDTWTPDELRTFLDGMREHSLAPAFVVAAATGMRRGEVLGLRWQDVDLDRGTASVRQTVLNVGYKL